MTIGTSIVIDPVMTASTGGNLSVLAVITGSMTIGTSIARIVSAAVAGVEPRIMGIGPIKAIPKALKLAGLKQEDIALIELNEAFASQSLAVIRTLDLNPDIVNINGGAIALGHPLGCTGTKLTVQVLDALRQDNKNNKYGMVTMCVGTGQGAAGIFEFLN